MSNGSANDINILLMLISILDIQCGDHLVSPVVTLIQAWAVIMIEDNDREGVKPSLLSGCLLKMSALEVARLFLALKSAS